jgi:hypothetical protein
MKNTVIASMQSVPGRNTRFEQLKFSLFYSGFIMQSDSYAGDYREDETWRSASERLNDWIIETSILPNEGETSTTRILFQMEEMKRTLLDVFPSTNGMDYSNTQLRTILGSAFYEFRENWFRNVIILLHRQVIENDDRHGWIVHAYVRPHDRIKSEDLSMTVKMCGSCKKFKQLKHCGRCVRISYCSVECQANHWMEHKIDCKKYSKK